MVIVMSVPRHFWREKSIRRAYLDWLMPQLGLKSPEDWLRVSVEQFESIARKSMINDYYDHSIKKAVIDLYPELGAHQWTAGHKMHNFWDSLDNQRLFVDHLRSELKLNSLDDLLNV